MRSPAKLALQSILALLGLAVSAFGQGAGSPAGNEPPEGTLDTFISREGKDVNSQLALILQTLYEERSDTTLLLFEHDYGARVHTKRIFYAANTADHEYVPAYVFTPADLPAGKKLPGLVMVHGGYHAQLEYGYFELIAAAVAHGYAVIWPEYRGSSGYGETVYMNQYGQTDVADVIAAADYLAKKDFVDPTRMGILGHSRGAMVTVLTIERYPKRFQAAVEIAGIMDFVGYMAYKPDARRHDVAQEKQFGGKLPSDNLAAYLDIEALNHTDSIETPLLALATTGDKIVPVSLNTARLADVLKAKGKVFDSHIYINAPGGHMFLNADTDEGRDCFERSFAWLGKYLHP